MVTGPGLTKAPRAALRVLGIDPGKHVGIAVLDVGASQASLVAMGAHEADGLDLLQLLDVYAAHAPALVALERVEHVHGSSRMGSSYAEGLTRAAWIGGELAGLARHRGLEVVTVEAARWRSALVGSRTASDGEIARVVRLRVPGWPLRSNAHERDAAGVALWAGLAPAGARA